MIRHAVFGAALLAASAALAQVPENPVGYTGALVSASDTEVVLTLKDGTAKTVVMTPGWTVSKPRATTADAVKAGDFVASMQTNIDATSGRAEEVRIFEPGYRPENGTHGIPRPNSSMTHATVARNSASEGGARTLLVTAPDGQRRIIVPAGVKVTAFDPLPRSALKPGTTVSAITRRGADNVFRAGRLTLAAD